MDKKTLIRSILFLLIGIAIFWWVFRGTDWNNLVQEFRKVEWIWIMVSLVLNLLALTIRAFRWKALFIPMQYNPHTFNLFLGNVVMAFTNQVIPRGGEIARLGVVNKTDRVPFAKLFGTVLVERLTDLVILFMIFIALIVWKFDLFQKILQLPQVSLDNLDLQKALVIAGIAIFIILTGIIAINRFNLLARFKGKIRQFRDDVKEGFTSLRHVQNKTLYFSLSVAIYITSFFMFYFLFFALPATSGLSFSAAVFTFGVATLAFLLPIQAGLGAWHFLVIQCLLLFGIESETGKAFSLIAHAATNLVNIPLGAIAFGILAFQRKKTDKKKATSR